jgi:hypothetical protein
MRAAAANDPEMVSLAIQYVWMNRGDGIGGVSAVLPGQYEVGLPWQDD